MSDDVVNVAQVDTLPLLASHWVATATKRDTLLRKSSIFLHIIRLGNWGCQSFVTMLELQNWVNHQTRLGNSCGDITKVARDSSEWVTWDHQGIVCMKEIACSYVWWEGIDKGIETLVKPCKFCRTVQNLPPMAPLHLWLWPTKPWQWLHADFAGPFQGRMYLLVSDAHFKRPKIIEMKNTTSNRTIEKLHKLLASYRLPKQLVTDNGPQKNLLLSSKQTANGTVERLVQTFKKSMKASQLIEDHTHKE